MKRDIFFLATGLILTASAAAASSGQDPEALYPQLVKRYEAPRLKPPFNLEARSRAGFSAEELRALDAAQ